MTILYFADIRLPLERANGIQTMETCHALARRGHVVSLIVRPDTHSPARDPLAFYGLPPVDTLRIERAPVTGPTVTRRAGYLAFALGRAMGAGRADAAMTRDLGLASVLLRIPRSARPPLIYESHGYAPDVAEALPELVPAARPPSRAKLARLARREARVWRAAEGYVTITSGLADEMRAKLGPRDRLAIIPDGTRLAAISGEGAAPARDPRRKPVVAYAGHLYAWKGVDVLLDVIAAVPEVEGLIAGGHEAEPDLARLKSRAASLGIQERVKFTGMVLPSQVGALLRSADVLVLPNPPSAISTRFTSPLKLFEYMAASRPIVASDLPAIREVLDDNVTALLVPAGDAPGIAAAVRRLIADRGLGDRLARAAAHAVPDYSWDRRAERIEALLHQITSPQG
jgi:glycosyltransferase involved in cell wall biosynthesis